MSRVVAVLHDPTPAEVRAAVRAHATAAGGGASAGADTHDLDVAVTEVVANAVEHGLPPVQVALRQTARGLEVTVTDSGSGPRDPFPSGPTDVARERGRGRRLAHQLVEVRERVLADGYEVRLTRRPTTGRGGGGADD